MVGNVSAKETFSAFEIYPVTVMPQKAPEFDIIGILFQFHQVGSTFTGEAVTADNKYFSPHRTAPQSMT